MNPASSSKFFSVWTLLTLLGSGSLLAEERNTSNRISAQRFIVFESKSNRDQLPLRHPRQQDNQPIPASETFGRAGQILGVMTGDWTTYLIVRMVDTDERLYFSYSGLFSSESLPYVPAGTRFANDLPKNPLPSAPRKSKPPKRAPSPPQPSPTESSDGSNSLFIIILVIAGFIFFVKASMTAPKPLDVRVTWSSDLGMMGSESRTTSHNGDRFWKGPGEITKIAGQEIPGGMLYVGSGLTSVGNGGEEPGLVDPKLRVAKAITDLSVRRLPYWPTYAGASPEARSCYIRWLSTGRQDPAADAGYIFLFFYGLERRALHDATSSQGAKNEIPVIAREVARLLEIYKNNSFQNYGQAFLDRLSAQAMSSKLYEAPPTSFSNRALRFQHRLGLAQCAFQQKPLPAEWAYAWLMGDPSTRLRTPATRCPDQFKSLFLSIYSKDFGTGLVLPSTKTRLRFDYRPASSGFGFNREALAIRFDLPDVTTLSNPMRQLQSTAESCCVKLEPFSRAIGRGASIEAFDTIALLPPEIWPAKYIASINELRSLISKEESVATLQFMAFRGKFPGWEEPSRSNYEAICEALGSRGIGIEPDPLFGGTVPADSGTIAIFPLKVRETSASSNPHYSAAALTIHLASAVAWADGKIEPEERALILNGLENWLSFGADNQNRLKALSMRLLIDPPKISGLKTRVGELDRASKQSLANFIGLVAHCDRLISIDEVKNLEKVFRLLGIENESVYATIHAATVPVPVGYPTNAQTGFAVPKPPQSSLIATSLDPARVAALRADSERVSAILAPIFADPNPSQESVLPAYQDIAAPVDSLLGLDEDSSAFLRVLLVRAQWSRNELEEIAQERGLLLDGILERANDAAHQKFGESLFEGEDPIDLSTEVLKELLNGSHKAA